MGAALLVATYLLLLCGGAAALLLGLVGGAARHAAAHEEAYALYRARWVLRAEGSLLGCLLRSRQLRCSGHDHAYTRMAPPPVARSDRAPNSCEVSRKMTLYIYIYISYI